MNRAVSICNHCPVLAACERQLQEFETTGRKVHGIMAARAYEGRDKERFTATPGDAEGGACIGCGRTMHIRHSARKNQVTTIPEGHAWFKGRRRCTACYRRHIEVPAARRRRAASPQQ